MAALSVMAAIKRGYLSRGGMIPREERPIIIPIDPRNKERSFLLSTKLARHKPPRARPDRKVDKISDRAKKDESRKKVRTLSQMARYMVAAKLERPYPARIIQ